MNLRVREVCAAVHGATVEPRSLLEMIELTLFSTKPSFVSPSSASRSSFFISERPLRGRMTPSYGDRIVIFKERGLRFPANFSSIGHIEFEADSIQAKATDLLKELIGFGLVKLMPTG